MAYCLYMPNEVFAPVRTKRSLCGYLAVTLRGFCMGAADIVPGVSGGTMAFIMGIYEELIDSIRMFGRKEFIIEIAHFRFRQALKLLNLSFLIALGIGILTAVLTLSSGLEYLLAFHPVPVWSFFFGLVLASMHVVYLRVPLWTPLLWALFAIGTAGSYVFVGLIPVQTPDHPLFLIFSGAVAICAMILPGISGSFLLVLLGKYEFILQAVSDRDLVTVGYVAFGAVVGILAFSHVLSWLLHRYHDRTMAVLVGMMLGSLRKIWPWKEYDGMTEIGNAWPQPFVGGAIDTSFLVSVLLMALGFIVVFVLERYAKKMSA